MDPAKKENKESRAEVKSQKPKTWIAAIIIGSIFLLSILLLPLFFALSPSKLSTGNVAVIEIRGVITEDGSSTLGDYTASAGEIISYIEDADSDPSIKAIVIDINTPGGSAVASDEIAQAIKRAEKPTVAFIHEMGTSGGYWIASATDTIIANRMSITGSIGVIASYLEFSGLMEEYGITYQRMVAGKYKDVGTPFKQSTSEEQQLLQSKLDKIHEFFIQEIADNRELSKAEVKRLATGEIFLGEEALKLCLVDKLGDKQALESHLNEIGIKNVEYTYYQREPTLFELISGVTAEHFFFMGKGIGSAMTEQNQGIMT